MSDKTHKMNGLIVKTFRQVKLIDDQGENLGLVDSETALRIAEEKNLDLVLVSSAGAPVCKICDYQKSLYESKKKKKSTKTPKMRCIKFGIGTDVHDYNVKVRKVTELLEDGAKVQIVLKCRGRREIAHISTVGLETMQKIITDLAQIARVEQQPKINGSMVASILSALKTSQKKQPKQQHVVKDNDSQ